MKIGILEPNYFSDLGIKRLRELGEVFLYEDIISLEIFLTPIDVLFIRLDYQINKDFLDKCINLKILCSPTTGLNHIDINLLDERKINLISLKERTHLLSNIRATPENTIGLALALIRGYSKVFLNAENSNWDRYKFYGDELQNMKVGIIGFGRVGTQITKYLNSFSSKIFVYDIKIISTDLNITILNSIEEIINKCQMIFLTASYSNKIIIKDHHIDALKDKYFINTSRGELIDEKYLVKKLNSNHFRGLAIDVISNENRSKNNLKHFIKSVEKYNIIVTPHISGVTIESLNKTEEILINALIESL
jgi:D-3-phosphoglycerate dehydrogenase